MRGCHQAAMNRAQPTVVTERQLAFVPSNAGHRKDKELDAEQRIDNTQVEQKNVVGTDLENV